MANEPKFIFEKAADEQVDDQYRLEGTQVAIQSTPYAYPYLYHVGVWVESEGALYNYGEFKTFGNAKRAALKASKLHSADGRKL